MKFISATYGRGSSSLCYSKHIKRLSIICLNHSCKMTQTILPQALQNLICRYALALKIDERINHKKPNRLVVPAHIQLTISKSLKTPERLQNIPGTIFCYVINVYAFGLDFEKHYSIWYDPFKGHQHRIYTDNHWFDYFTHKILNKNSFT